MKMGELRALRYSAKPSLCVRNRFRPGMCIPQSRTVSAVAAEQNGATYPATPDGLPVAENTPLGSQAADHHKAAECGSQFPADSLRSVNASSPPGRAREWLRAEQHDVSPGTREASPASDENIPRFRVPPGATLRIQHPAACPAKRLLSAGSTIPASPQIVPDLFPERVHHSDALREFGFAVQENEKQSQAVT